jgi:hypothetical protein
MGAVRRLEVFVAKSDAFEIRCSACAWVFRIEHQELAINRADEDRAAREFTIHNCVDYPRKGIAKGNAN